MYVKTKRRTTEEKCQGRRGRT